MEFSKKVLAGVAVAAAVALSAVVAPVATAAGNSSATGGGTAEEAGGISTFVFNAIKNGKGDVTGHLVYHVRAWPITIMMEPDCLRIAGNVATIGGFVTKVSEEIPGFIFVGQDAVFLVADNGQGANSDPDTFSDLFLEAGTVCTDSKYDADSFAPYIPVSGNIQVR